MDPLSVKPRPRRIAAVLVAQIEALSAGDARCIETLHRSRPMDDNPAFHRATAHLAATGREGEWHQAQAAIFDAVAACGLSQRVRYAAYDAALALLTRDLLDRASFTMLYGPWAGARDDHVTMVG